MRAIVCALEAQERLIISDSDRNLRQKVSGKASILGVRQLHTLSLCSHTSLCGWIYSEVRGHAAHPSLSLLPGILAILSSVCLSVTLCIVAKRYILRQKCLNKWGNMKCPRNTILQLSTPPPTLSPQTLHPQNLEILLLYCISLDQATILFTLLLATNIGENIK